MLCGCSMCSDLHFPNTFLMRLLMTPHNRRVVIMRFFFRPLLPPSLESWPRQASGAALHATRAQSNPEQKQSLLGLAPVACLASFSICCTLRHGWSFWAHCKPVALSQQSIAFAMNGNTAICILGGDSGGLLAPLADAAEKSVASMAGGFSLHSSFEPPVGVCTAGENRMHVRGE